MRLLYCLVITGISLSGCASLETRTDVYAQREVVLYETAPMLVRVATNTTQTSDAPMQCVKLVRTQRSEERVSRYQAKGIVDGLLLSSALMAGGVLLLGISSALEEPASHGLARGTSTHSRGDGVAALGEGMVLSGTVVADQAGFVIDQSLLYPPVTDTRVSYREKLVKLDMHVCDPSAAPAVQPVVQSAPRFLSPSSTLTSAEAIGLASAHLEPLARGCETTTREERYTRGKLKSLIQHCEGDPTRLMGLSYEYYGDGERVKEITGYVNGVPEGHWFAFDFMGELKGEAFYKDGALSEAPGVDGGEPAP